MKREIMHIHKFPVTGIGECELQVWKQDNDTNPMAYIVFNNSDIICALNIFGYGGIYNSNLTKAQKYDIDSGINGMRFVQDANIYVPAWHDMCVCWKDLNNNEDLNLPEVPPDYFGFRSNTNPK